MGARWDVVSVLTLVGHKKSLGSRVASNERGPQTPHDSSMR
jgi:hypothetical protein